MLSRIDVAKEWAIQMIYFIQQNHLKKVSVQKSNVICNKSASTASIVILLSNRTNRFFF